MESATLNTRSGRRRSREQVTTGGGGSGRASHGEENSGRRTTRGLAAMLRIQEMQEHQDRRDDLDAAAQHDREEQVEENDMEEEDDDEDDEDDEEEVLVEVNDDEEDLISREGREMAEEFVALSQTENGKRLVLKDESLAQIKSLLDMKLAETTVLDLLQALSNVCEQMNGRYKVVRSDMVRTIIGLVLDDSRVRQQRLGLQVLRALSLIEYGREALVDNDAVEILVQLIKSEDLQVRCNALRTTFNLSVVNVTIRQSIVQAGALPYLIRAAQEPSDGQCAAVGTLANLATESDIKRSIVKEYGGLKPLLKLLVSNDTSILTHACRALFAIAANDENKLAITREQGLPLLLDCMNSVCDAVRMNAAGALANLAIHPVNKLKLVEHGALTHLRNLAYSNNCKIQRQVARCLFALAAHVENRRAILEENCLKALVFLLRSDNSDVQVNAAGAIGNIAMTDEFKKPVVDSGALVRLIDLAKVRDARVQRQAARAIFTLTAKEFSKRKLAEHDGLPALISLTRSSNEDIQRDAAGALANMAIGSENKDRIVELHGLEPLIALLRSRAVAVQRQSARAIFALAGNASNQASILKAGGLTPLIELLCSDNDEVRKHACGAIANMANRHPNKVVQGGALDILVDIVLSHHSLEVRRQAARAVFNLTPPGKRRGQMVLSPYAGTQGEQQRVRHDMRALFGLVVDMQEKAGLYHLPDRRPVTSAEAASASDAERRVLESSRPVTRNSLRANTTSIPSSQPAQQTSTRKASAAAPPRTSSGPSSGSLSGTRGRKRSSDNLLANFYPFQQQQQLQQQQQQRKVIQKQKRHGLEYDIRVAVPILVQQEDLSSLMNEETKGGDLPRGKPSVLYLDFVGHAAILCARCDLFADLVIQETATSDQHQNQQNERQQSQQRRGVQGQNDPNSGNLFSFESKVSDDKNAENRDSDHQELFIQVPKEFANVELVWAALFEYLYTDSVRMHAQTLRNNASLAESLAELALQLGLPRLCCFCTELNSAIEEANPLLSEKTQDRGRESTWVRDMAKLLHSYPSPNPQVVLPDFSDLEVQMDPEFAESAPKSPRLFNFCELPALPSSPRLLSEMSPKRMRTSENKSALRPALSRFSAHKVILAARCSYFKAQFGGTGWRDANSDTVRFSGTEKAFKVILRYLYCGADAEVQQALNADPSLALQVLVISNEYNLDGLQLLCESHLLWWIEDRTVFILLQELELVHAPLLRSVCLLYLLRNKLKHFQEIVSNSDDDESVMDVDRPETVMRFSLMLPVQDTKLVDPGFVKELTKELELTGVKWGFIKKSRHASGDMANHNNTNKA